MLERRDSVLHRAGALAWHVGWLFQLHGHRSDYANDLTVMFDDGRAMNNLMGAIRDSLYVFDDIVLNSVSLLDYLAQYLACALAGKGVPRWDGLVYLVQRKDGPSVFGAEVAQMVTQLNQAWVRRLVDHRNYIAHQTASQAEGARTLHPQALTTTLSVDLPPTSHALLEAMGQSPVTTDLLSGAEHIGMTCLGASVDLLAVASTAHKIEPGFVPMSF